MKHVFTALALFLSVTVSTQNFFADTDAFLKSHVKKGLVDYSQIKQIPAKLDALLKQLANAPECKTDEEKKAFLINAYNLFVIKGIVDHYPTKGPLTIDGFF